MKVCVEKLPKDCIDCPCESEYYCNLLNEDVGCCEWGEIHKNCPLQSLADYTKQVRNNTFDKISSEYAKRLSAFMRTKISVSTAMSKLDEVLDQLQGKTK